MAIEPTTNGATGLVLLAAILSSIPGLDAATVLGSFAGSVVFVMASNDLTNWKKAGFFLASFIGGLLAASLAASILSFFLPSALAVSHGVGALVASAVAVKVLLWLLARDPGKIIEALRGAKS